MFYWFIKGLAWPLVRVYLRFRRRGLGNVPAAGPCIVVANHTSYLDATVLGSASPRRMRFLIAWDIYRLLRLRWFYYMMGSIPLRTSGSDTRALRRALEALRGGQAVAIFPEGQRMPDGRVGEGKLGVAFLAARSGAPVIPAGIVGAHESMPVGSAFPRPRRVQVVFGVPMRFPGDGARAGKDELMVFANEIMAAIAALVEAEERRERAEGVGEAAGERLL